MRLRRPLPAVQGDSLHIVGVGDNRIGKQHTIAMKVLLIYVGAFPDEKLHDFLMRFQDGIEERCPVAASFEFEEYDDDCPGPPYAVC